jgi:hypothetical protein
MENSVWNTAKARELLWPIICVQLLGPIEHSAARHYANISIPLNVGQRQIGGVFGITLTPVPADNHESEA